MENKWRAALAQDSRQKIVNRIMETLQRYMPVSGQEGMNDLRKIAWRFEQKIFQDATDQLCSRLEKEMRQINDQLIDTTIELCPDCTEEAAVDGGGVVVTCSYNTFAVNPNTTFHGNSTHMIFLSPIRLIIPYSYPDCSPIVLTDRSAPDFNHTISRLARDMFVTVIRCLPPPVSLGAIAKAWSECARTAVAKVAYLHGGGSFSSSCGVWESCVSA